VFDDVTENFVINVVIKTVYNERSLFW
jgi:hypothetical protein